MSYVVWDSRHNSGYCGLTGLKGVGKIAEFRKGVSRAGDFPANAAFHMDPDHPKDVKLGDQPPNLDRLKVVSRKLREVLDAFKPNHIEWLKVTIFNHKGVVSSDDYWIANVLEVVDCIDQKKSDIEWNPIDKEKICSCSKLVLLPKTIDPAKPLFRMKYLANVMLVREDLAAAMKKGGFDGPVFDEIEDYSGF